MASPPVCFLSELICSTSLAWSFLPAYASPRVYAFCCCSKGMFDQSRAPDVVASISSSQSSYRVKSSAQRARPLRCADPPSLGPFF